jgi:hypothetical protein
LTDPNNPLTARVIVNRIWQHHFGKGIVATPNDFGVRGRSPTHHRLLDYLASRFRAANYSIKAMHRLIMLSQTYQLASQDFPEGVKADADNDLLWRFHRRRLDAEALHDAMLAVSGELDRTLHGAHPIPGAEWKVTPSPAKYESNCRSVYLVQARSQKHPFFEIFDGADPKASTAERRPSATPLQALFLANDKFTHRQAEKFADRLRGARADHGQRIDLAYELAFSRPPTQEETKRDLALLQQLRDELNATDVPADQHSRTAWAIYARLLFSTNEFIFVD